MQSETDARRVLDLLRPSFESFGSALTATLEELRAVLEERDEDERGPQKPNAAPLGAFADGRIDAGRFEALLVRAPHRDPGGTPVLRRAFGTLSELAARRESLFRLSIPSGGRLAEAVHVALEDIGRAFGAARVVDRVRAGRFEEGSHGEWLAKFPFSLWDARERSLAPPLVVEVSGADFHPEGLAEFLDGGVRLVLLVEPPAPPAALVRLVTPAVSVLQTDALEGDSGLASFLELPAPAVAAYVPEGAATFRHRGGDAECAPLEVGTPPPEPIGPIGGRSAAQLRDDHALFLARAARPETPSAAPLLTATAAPAPAAPATGEAAPGTNDVDRLAAWLIAQADLSDLGGVAPRAEGGSG